MTDSFTLTDLEEIDPLVAEKVLVTPTGCFEYGGYCLPLPDGYGIVGRGGKTLKVHRYVWSLLNGPIPAGLGVLHRCDNPPCLNVDHLFLGTQGDNVVDMAKKGRHGQSTLSNEQVAEIRERVATGEVQRHLAFEYGVLPPCISRIVSGKRRA